MAFEKFLASLPAHLLRQDNPITPRPAAAPQNPAASAPRAPEAEPQEKIGITLRKEAPKAGRNDPCPCGSGKKYKNCCGRNA
jgi:preprotein translocase subunit SecA